MRRFERQAFASAGDDDLRQAATSCIGKVRQRGYASVAEFGQDLRECLSLITIRNDRDGRARRGDSGLARSAQSPHRGPLDALPV